MTEEGALADNLKTKEEKTMTTIYLAGPVHHVEDNGQTWRDRVVEEWNDKFNFNNPLDKYDTPINNLTVVPNESNPDDATTIGTNEIIEDDKELLRDADGVLVGYESVRSIGTPMEVMWAYEREYPIALWLRDNTPPSNLSPWYQYHTNIISDSLCEIMDYLEGEEHAQRC